MERKKMRWQAKRSLTAKPRNSLIPENKNTRTVHGLSGYFCFIRDDMLKKTMKNVYHIIYKTGIALKAIVGVIEVIAGTAFLFMSHAAIYSLINSVFGGRLGENSGDWFWQIVSAGLNDLATSGEGVWAFVFLSHGIIKLLLIGGLWKERLWSYPTSAFVFTLFIFYQAYQLASIWSFALFAITALDVAIVALVLYEYSIKKKELEILTI